MKIISYEPEAYVPFTNEMLADISLALMNCGVSNECQMCKQGRMQIVPGASNSILQNRGPEINMLVGQPIFCAVTICDHCGHKEEYDLGRLGLLEKFMPFFEAQLAQDKYSGRSD